MASFGYSDPTKKPPAVNGQDWVWAPERGSWKLAGGNPSIPSTGLPSGTVAGQPQQHLPQQAFQPASFTPGSYGGSSFQSGPTGGIGTSPTIPNPFGSGGSSAPGGDTGMSAYEKWMLGLNIAGGLAGAYSQYKGGQQQHADSQAQLDEQKREFDATKLQGAPALARTLDASPMRDRAIYLMTQRLGMNPRQFHGETLTQGGSPGGIDPAAMAKANNSYTPGAGGTGASDEIIKKILSGMGYPYGS